MHRRVLLWALIGVPLAGCTSAKETGQQPAPASTARIAPNQIPSYPEDWYVSFPALGVKLVRPVGFDDADKLYYGFEQPSTESWIRAVKMPWSISHTEQVFSPDSLRARGAILHSRESLEIGGKPAVLRNFTESEHGRDFEKWTLLIGDEEKTVTITAKFPKALQAQLSAPLRSAVLATKLDHAPPPTPGEDLNFKIVGSPKLKAATGIGKTITYTKDGTFPLQSLADPVFVAAPSLSKVTATDRREFALGRLSLTSVGRIRTIRSTESISIDGMDGFESIAEVEHDSGASLILYQALLYDGDSYILMRGKVDVAEADEYLPEFKAMARSLTRKKR